MTVPDLSGVAVLVTGGAGFIGSHLVAALVAKGARVRVLDNLENGTRARLAGCEHEIELMVGDLRDLDACRAACQGIACVFHQAALGSVPRSLADPATTLAVNVGGTANLLAAAREGGVSRLVYASSSSVYGDGAGLPNREGAEGTPLSPYAASKRLGEELAALFQRCYGLQTVGLRYFNVYGPGQDPAGPYAAVIPRFFQAYLRGAAPVIYGDGQQSRDFTFLDDAVRANLLAAGADGAGGAAYNVASGRAVTVRDLAQLVRRLVGGGPAPTHTAARPGEIRHSVADLTAARARLGYEPHYDLEAGLARCLPHYRALEAG
jgi:nucleoside-diphosphate-sugar epimerase